MFWLIFLGVVSFLAETWVPIGFVAAVIFIRYCLELVIDGIEVIVDFTLDLIDLVIYVLTTKQLDFPWWNVPGLSHIISIAIQLLFLGVFVAFLAYLTASRRKDFLPTRQNLQDLLDRALQKDQEKENRLLILQRSADKFEGLYGAVQWQNKRLQAENEQLNRTKGSFEPKIAKLQDDLKNNRIRHRSLAQSFDSAQDSLRVAERNADRSEQARKAAENKALKLTEELVNAQRPVVPLPKVTNDSRKKSDHTKCIQSAARQADRVEALQKSLVDLQAVQQDSLRRHATEISALQQHTEPDHTECLNAAASQTCRADELQKEVLNLQGQQQGLLQIRATETSTFQNAFTAEQQSRQVFQNQAALLTMSIQDHQSRLSQLEASLANKHASLIDAHAKIQDMSNQAVQLAATKAATTDLDKISQLERDLEKKDLNLQEAQTKVMNLKDQVDEFQAAAAMTVDNPAVESQSKEIADLKAQVSGLQAALGQAQPVGKGKEVDRHQCDHSGCHQREVAQDSRAAKLQANIDFQVKRISDLEGRVREQEFNLQNTSGIGSSRAASVAVPPPRNERPGNSARKVIQELQDSLRRKDMELKDLAEQLRIDRLAATTRVEEGVREQVAAYKKAMEDMKEQRDRTRSNNSSLMQRNTHAETALTQLEGQRDDAVAETGRLTGELYRVVGGGNVSGPRKRGMDGEEEGQRPSKVGRTLE